MGREGAGVESVRGGEWRGKAGRQGEWGTGRTINEEGGDQCSGRSIPSPSS